MEVGSGSQRRPWPRPAGPMELSDSHAVAEEELAWLPYWMLLSRWWLFILIVTVVAAAAVWTVNKYYVQKWYRASAVLTPVAKPLTPGANGMMAATGGASILDLLGGSMNDSNAQEYMSILKSYAFTISMAERHQPLMVFAIDANDGVAPPTKWQLYNIISGNFGCDFNLKSGDLNLSFVAKTRDEAQRILGYYIDDLRDKLRGREMHEAGIAVASLRDEINKTSDSLLQSQLYELMASQVQREKLAQVEADFAFTVIEPPVAPDNAFKPHPTRSALLVVIFAPLAIFGTLRAIEQLGHMAAHARRRYPSNRSVNDAAAVD
jgi:hypothetical protein